MKSTRLFCLDFLRGLDIFLLTALGLLLRACDRIWHFSPFWKSQLDHLPWDGFTTWDMILPLFLFMSGAAIPFAVSKRLSDGCPTVAFWKHLAGRFALLWMLGLIAQGGILTLDPAKMRPFVNVLQTMAVLMVVTSLWYLIRSWKVRVAVPVVAFVLYFLLMQFGGDYTKEGNLVSKMGAWNDAVGLPKNFMPFFYTMIVSACVYGPVGALSTLWLRSGASARQKTLTLLGVGLGMMALAALCVFCGIPIVKRVFSPSYTLLTLGGSLFLMGLCYQLTDVWGLRRGTWIFILYGQCSLAAYLIHIRDIRPVLRAAGELFTQGLPRVFGTRYQELFTAVAMTVILTVALHLWRKLRQARENRP